MTVDQHIRKLFVDCYVGLPHIDVRMHQAAEHMTSAFIDWLIEDLVTVDEVRACSTFEELLTLGSEVAEKRIAQLPPDVQAVARESIDNANKVLREELAMLKEEVGQLPPASRR
ncbi:hypothetical protein [Aeoliella mucimassa]|uniref:Uncharacterized protein n=1 Tax=Aeoliella mucimassa TaxID=2527972 RepID=A0A518ARM9_9BACT|nr:hypothetical protein [Aeoliella mucimassa]QDU57383.1 hypothetical protein Pan181_35980 [Aeoliella mucimassa]